MLVRVLVASFGSTHPASQSASSDRWIRGFVFFLGRFENTPQEV
jgi:hypothetical protein